MKKIKSAFKNQKGATAIEYGLLIGFLGIALVVSLSSIGTSLNTTFTNVENSFPSSEAEQ